MWTFGWADRLGFLNTKGGTMPFCSGLAWISYKTIAAVTPSVQCRSWLTWRWHVSNYALKAAGNMPSAGSLDTRVTPCSHFLFREKRRWAKLRQCCLPDFSLRTCANHQKATPSSLSISLGCVWLSLLAAAESCTLWHLPRILSIWLKKHRVMGKQWLTLSHCGIQSQGEYLQTALQIGMDVH